MTPGGGYSTVTAWNFITFLATKPVEKGEYYIDVEMYNYLDQTKDSTANGFAMLIEVIP